MYIAAFATVAVETIVPLMSPAKIISFLIM
jgi:hypothetical protein